ncbi:hypothetical protein LCL89_05560 [Halobacillus yeomjeoni]|uniref:hypothetical protein n=1 Tax=Halobacillus yeomjeoni TaxID=311194 RepID=UPI001CD405DF|nr:hypothetical protein [Halobacillus yeomjeoni]MCA0983519.1 hypothetical protein [Halobacillus yeomjeoni]
MWEIIRGNEYFYIITYSLIVLIINLDYLRDFKKIKKGLSDISSDEELEVDPKSMSLLIIVLIFNFFRRWFIYLLAVLITENILVIVISFILFVVSLYDSIFNYSLTKVKKSNIALYLAVIDAIYISIFVIYLLII